MTAESDLMHSLSQYVLRCMVCVLFVQVLLLFWCVVTQQAAQEDNLKLRQSFQCNICMENDVSVCGGC